MALYALWVSSFWAHLWPFVLKSLCSFVACPFVFESFLLLAAGQWVLLASSSVPFFTVVSDSLFYCLRVFCCLELVLSGFFLCPLLQRAVCVEAHKYFIAALWPSEAKPLISVVFFWTHGHLFITLGQGWWCAGKRPGVCYSSSPTSTCASLPALAGSWPFPKDTGHIPWGQERDLCSSLITASTQ